MNFSSLSASVESTLTEFLPNHPRLTQEGVIRLLTNSTKSALILLIILVVLYSHGRARSAGGAGLIVLFISPQRGSG